MVTFGNRGNVIVAYATQGNINLLCCLYKKTGIKPTHTTM